MKNKLIFTLVLLLSISACGKKKKMEEPKSTTAPKEEVFSSVDIPVAGVTSFFDGDIAEFDDANLIDSTQAIDVAQIYDSPDLAWSELAEGTFKTVYFDFDSDRIRADQDENLAYNVDLIKKKINDRNNNRTASPMTIVIEGHSCHSAGSSVYNLALSERRAKQLKDQLLAAGIPQDLIKIVGRGQEIPAIINGRPVDGDRQAQWPNRRDEIRIIYA